MNGVRSMETSMYQQNRSDEHPNMDDSPDFPKCSWGGLLCLNPVPQKTNARVPRWNRIILRYLGRPKWDDESNVLMYTKYLESAIVDTRANTRYMFKDVYQVSASAYIMLGICLYYVCKKYINK